MDQFNCRFFHRVLAGRLLFAALSGRCLGCNRAQPRMTPIAVGRILRVLAHAEMRFRLLLDGEREGLEGAARVRAVAERLLVRVAARAPVVLAGLEVDTDGLLVRDGGFVRHGGQLT